MQKNNPFFDDLARMATGAGSMMLEWRKEIDQMIQVQMDKMATRMHSVSREEFEAVRDMAQAARLENEELKKRLEALEKTAKPAAVKKAPAKKAAATKKASATKKKPTTAKKA